MTVKVEGQVFLSKTPVTPEIGWVPVISERVSLPTDHWFEGKTTVKLFGFIRMTVKHRFRLVEENE